jgi:hypothetical protein
LAQEPLVLHQPQEPIYLLSSDIPEIKFSITPNPIANVGSVKTNMEKCNITIFDNLGRKLFDKIINYDVDIDFSNWVSGIYSIRYSDLQSSQSMTEKFVIK